MTSERCAPPDWQAPWYAPLRTHGRVAWAQWAVGLSLADALNACGAAPVRFAPQRALPPGVAYEQFIRTRGAVPTRDNLHDFFNGLLWHALPRTKARLNRIQADEIARLGVGATRGAVRDAATLFDENALLLHAPDALWRALVARDWDAAFGNLRPEWVRCRVLVFGHAALEKLARPYKGITCHVWRVAPAFDPAGDLCALDAWLAADLQPARLANKPFAPLPVLGIPGWWPANREPAFYADARVFRPARRAPFMHARRP